MPEPIIEPATTAAAEGSPRVGRKSSAGALVEWLGITRSYQKDAQNARPSSALPSLFIRIPTVGNYGEPE
ncbi:MAG: hypothetical protein IPK79_12765 [Vampirovibrionales bacterium]|nr:hypothetical protein [Vampirovibrionales bacterium]